MASPSSTPYFRAGLFPIADFWTGGPGISWPIIRFGLPAAWQTTGANLPGGVGTTLFSVLTLEMPYSVLPFGLRQGVNVLCDLTVPEPWQTHPVPGWRGVPCRLGTTLMRLA